MDPTANLDQMRRLAERILREPTGERRRRRPGRTAADAYRLAELVEALDEWLVMGGALPTRWKPGRP